MAQYRYHYKDYPKAPSLTKKSELIGKLTNPLIAIIISMIPILVLGENHPMSVTYTVILLIALLILQPILRNAAFKLLDKKYLKMLEGKIPMQ